MSKDLHNNERYLRDLAEKYTPVPPPLVWDEIEHSLDKDKDKRRPFPILWMFGFLLMGVIVAINLRGDKDKDIVAVQQEIIYCNDQKQRDLNPSNIRKVDSEIADEFTQEQNANISETIPFVSEKQEEKEVDSEAIKTLAFRQQHSNQSLTKNTERYSQTNLNTNLLNVSTAEQPLIANTSTNPLNVSNADQSSIANTNTNLANAEEISSDEDGFSRPTIFTPSTASTVKERPMIGVATIERLKWMHGLFDTGATPPKPNKNLSVLPGFDRNYITSLSTSWFVELGGGIGRNLSNPELLDPMQGEFRLNTESKWYSWSTSIQFGYQFDNRWYTTFGFDLNQTKNKFDFWRRDISSMIVDGNQSFQITNSDFFSIGEISYTFLDFGLSLGRRIKIDKWHFSLEGGAIYNVIFSANGKVQVGGLEFSRLEDQGEYFNTQTGIGTRLSAMLDYPISDQLWISLGPNYHQYFKTVSSDQNSLKERNSILQLKAKVRCHF